MGYFETNDIRVIYKLLSTLYFPFPTFVRKLQIAFDCPIATNESSVQVPHLYYLLIRITAFDVRLLQRSQADYIAFPIRCCIILLAASTISE